jgi:hypothetical protein
MESLRGQVTCGRRSKTRAAKGDPPRLANSLLSTIPNQITPAL